MLSIFSRLRCRDCIWVRLLGLDPLSARRVYDAVDRKAAPFAAERIVALRSVWVKIGQYMSARTDVTSPRWVKALAALQDDLPADSLEDVHATLRDAFGGVFLRVRPDDDEDGAEDNEDKDENEEEDKKKKTKKTEPWCI